ncbi:hypothetical protein ACFLRX_08410 [Acidobacteriota bacterium]
MRKTTLLILILYLGLRTVGCISFNIIPSFPLEGYIETMVLCSDVDESGELLVPKEIKNEYTFGEKSVFCFIEIKNVSQRIQMRWKWYAPDKTLLRDSENVIVNREEQYLEELTAYDELLFDVQEQEKLIGLWTVVILIDDKLIARREFSVQETEKK